MGYKYKVGDIITWLYAYPEICKVTKVEMGDIEFVILSSSVSSRIGRKVSFPSRRLVKERFKPTTKKDLDDMMVDRL